jgi:NADH:ubiquinone oxidoreductase subunit 5 (subunit L)/multisubunit Na+/H+ antiporter MnhA subunit
VGIGAASGILGVLFALAQHDLKRLLAYSSVENIGIIAIGIGVGMLGISYEIPAMAFLGFLGALMHVINHSLFKSLLFLGAGAVQHGAGTRDMNRLGGLLKRMPTTGGTFLAGSCAISGLPPLNGFVGELLIYLGVLAGVADPNRSGGMAWAMLCMIAIGGLALIGGLSAACFTKAFGSVFLGEPRSEEAKNAHEGAPSMCASMCALAGGCIFIALSAPLWPIVLQAGVASIDPAFFHDAPKLILSKAVYPLSILCGASWGLLAIVSLLAFARRKLLAKRNVAQSPTWDCGYVAPTARMQYTASSFSAHLTQLFRMFLRPKNQLREPQGLFPAQASFQSETADVFRDYLYRPLFSMIAWAASKLRWLQHGRIQMYVLYIALTILVLLIWKLG